MFYSYLSYPVGIFVPIIVCLNVAWFMGKARGNVPDAVWLFQPYRYLRPVRFGTGIIFIFVF